VCNSLLLQPLGLKVGGASTVGFSLNPQSYRRSILPTTLTATATSLGGSKKITPDQIYQFCKYCEDRSSIDREIFGLAEITKIVVNKTSAKHQPSWWLTNIYLVHGRVLFCCYPLIFALILWLQQRRHFPVDLGSHTVAYVSRNAHWRMRVYKSM